jgi:hypothetical protein
MEVAVDEATTISRSKINEQTFRGSEVNQQKTEVRGQRTDNSDYDPKSKNCLLFSEF